MVSWSDTYIERSKSKTRVWALPIKQILKRANWSNKFDRQKLYNMDNETDNGRFRPDETHQTDSMTFESNNGSKIPPSWWVECLECCSKLNITSKGTNLLIFSYNIWSKLKLLNRIISSSCQIFVKWLIMLPMNLGGKPRKKEFPYFIFPLIQAKRTLRLADVIPRGSLQFFP